MSGIAHLNREVVKGQELHDLLIEVARLVLNNADEDRPDVLFAADELRAIATLAETDTLREIGCWSACPTEIPLTIDCGTWRRSVVGRRQLLHCCTEPPADSVGLAVRMFMEQRLDQWEANA